MQGFESARGAAWRIWDLHVHTPSSIVNGYGDGSDAAWAHFIKDLEALPSDTFGISGVERDVVCLECHDPPLTQACDRTLHQSDDAVDQTVRGRGPVRPR
jgi:hypothetical protein